MTQAKRLGQYFTPPDVVETLVRWSVRQEEDRILDPSCGDGEFLAAHEHAVGIEYDASHAASARKRAPAALVHQSDFFDWAGESHERFEIVVGNPPYIRYQGFSGAMRTRALDQAKRFGANLPALASSWAPFVAASALLLKPGGRMAFVIPAEIGHAAYAKPLVEAMCQRFERVGIVAVRDKIFPHLNEDAWILYASGYGGLTDEIEFTVQERFTPTREYPNPDHRISLAAFRGARGRLRRWLMPQATLQAYEHFETNLGVLRLGTMADVNIGYVSGANEFFHLRPSEAKSLRIDDEFLRVSLRRGGSLPATTRLTRNHVNRWIADDEPVLLLYVEGDFKRLPVSVRKYLDSKAGQKARTAYKCRERSPWYKVPDVKTPDGFLNCMSGGEVNLVSNAARCVATNSLHVISMKDGHVFTQAQAGFGSILSELSREVEGHPLGGGMLKLEPREAQRLLIPGQQVNAEVAEATAMIEAGLSAMRRWRHAE